MKFLFIASALALVGSCSNTKYSTKVQNIKDSIELVDSALVIKYANSITPNELKNHVYTISDNSFEGRATGEIGQKMAANYIKTFYQKNNIVSPMKDSSYFQTIPNSFLPNDTKTSENVLAFIRGYEKPNDVIIISAHYDHLGITEDDLINNGADDNGSGTSALLEIAQAFKLAQKEGYTPKRSVLFLHITAEEIGKLGSLYYTENPVFPLENTICDLNIDMIGRVDKGHANNKKYVYLIGSDKLSHELHYLSEKVNETYFNMYLDYKYNAEYDSNHYYTRSDHYNFVLKGIPVIFYFNGTHEDYHKPTDTADKIDFNLLTTRTKLIFATAWQLANQEGRILIDNGIFENTQSL